MKEHAKTASKDRGKSGVFEEVVWNGVDLFGEFLGDSLAELLFVVLVGVLIMVLRGCLGD